MDFPACQAIEAGHGVGGTAAAPSNPPLDVFSRLASDLDTEVRSRWFAASSAHHQIRSGHLNYERATCWTRARISCIAHG